MRDDFYCQIFIIRSKNKVFFICMSLPDCKLTKISPYLPFLPSCLKPCLVLLNAFEIDTSFGLGANLPYFPYTLLPFLLSYFPSSKSPYKYDRHFVKLLWKFPVTQFALIQIWMKQATNNRWDAQLLENGWQTMFLSALLHVKAIQPISTVKGNFRKQFKERGSTSGWWNKKYFRVQSNSCLVNKVVSRTPKKTLHCQTK